MYQDQPPPYSQAVAEQQIPTAPPGKRKFREMMKSMLCRIAIDSSFRFQYESFRKTWKYIVALAIIDANRRKICRFCWMNNDSKQKKIFRNSIPSNKWRSFCSILTYDNSEENSIYFWKISSHSSTNRMQAILKMSIFFRSEYGEPRVCTAVVPISTSNTADAINDNAAAAARGNA